MRNTERLSKYLQILTFAAFVAMIAVAAACATPSSDPGQVDSETDGIRTSAAPNDANDFDAQFYCKSTEGPIALERYLIGAQRADGLPSPSSPGYQDALPPICLVSPMGGVPPYTATASVDGQELRRITTGTTELSFLMPPLKPGWHTIEFTATDSRGKSGSGSANVELEWKDTNHIQVGFDKPAAQLAEFTPGEAVNFEVQYEAFEPSEQPQLGIEAFVSQNYSVMWDFGDGSTEPVDVDARTGVLTASHKYESEGLYKVSLSIKGRTYAQTGSATVSVDVRPAGSTRTESGEVVQQWNLVQTILNPVGADLRTRTVDKVFPDDSLNNFVEYTALLGSDSITLGKVTGKGDVDGYVGSYEIAATSLPKALTAGKSATFIIDGSVANSLGVDSAGETVRLSGLGAEDDGTMVINYEDATGSIERSFTVPSPGNLGDTLVITLSVDNCPACVVQWVYRYG